MSGGQCVYAIESDAGFCKIGIARNPWQRLIDLQIGNHTGLSLTIAVDVERDGVDALAMERRLHSVLAGYRVRGEWFQLPHVVLGQAFDWVWIELRYPEIVRRWYRRYASLSDAVLQSELAHCEPQSLWAGKPPFDKNAYQRDLMRKRRADKKAASK